MDWTAISLSLWLAAGTCALLLPMAVVLARWLAWQPTRTKSVVEALTLLPLVLPPTVLGFYLLVAFGPTTTLGAAVESLTGVALAFSFEGILLASLIVNLPFAVQPMQRAFEAVPQDVREAAWVSGLSDWRTFRLIELPLAWPGLLSAFVLVFAHTMGEFGVILMVGGNIPGETQTLSVAIYDSVQAFKNEQAALMSAMLLATSFAALAIVLAMARRGSARNG